MASGRGWSRTIGSARSFVGNTMGGLRGWSNLASWAVAGTLAYYLWVKPARQLRMEQEERAALATASDPYRYVEKRKPIPDPQETGLVYGKKDPTKNDNYFCWGQLATRCAIHCWKHCKDGLLPALWLYDKRYRLA